MAFITSLTATAHFVRSKHVKGAAPPTLLLLLASEFVPRAPESSCFSYNLIDPSAKSCGDSLNSRHKTCSKRKDSMIGCSGERTAGAVTMYTYTSGWRVLLALGLHIPPTAYTEMRAIHPTMKYTMRITRSEQLVSLFYCKMQVNKGSLNHARAPSCGTLRPVGGTAYCIPFLK